LKKENFFFGKNKKKEMRNDRWGCPEVPEGLCFVLTFFFFFIPGTQTEDLKTKYRKKEKKEKRKVSLVQKQNSEKLLKNIFFVILSALREITSDLVKAPLKQVKTLPSSVVMRRHAYHSKSSLLKQSLIFRMTKIKK
jgi:hypothetical protein